MVPFIDLTRQYKEIENEISSATRRVFEKGQFILGEEVSSFEEEFARYCGARYGVGVNSGTDALYLALKAAAIGEGDEVITVSHSFVASAMAISLAGAMPVFVDIDPETYTMSLPALESLLKKRKARGNWHKIKAILPVHLYGHPAKMDGIMEIASLYHLTVIEDACQAHGAEFEGKRTGSFGAMGCFSFYPTKNLGAYGDGGMVVTNHEKLYKILNLLRCYGEKKKYQHHLKSGNSRLDEIQAAILRTKLKHLDGWNQERRKKASIYEDILEGTGAVCPPEKSWAGHVYHLFVIRTKKRDALQDFLRTKGIGTLIHYPTPIHLQKAYKDLGYQRGDFPVTEKCAGEMLSLPFFPELRDEEMEMVGKQIKEYFKGIRSR